MSQRRRMVKRGGRIMDVQSIVAVRFVEALFWYPVAESIAKQFVPENAENENGVWRNHPLIPVRLSGVHAPGPFSKSSK